LSPPLTAEQHRIVAKVDELMALCDRLAVASLARLNAPDPETFQADARFTLNVLPALTTRPDQIKRLRQTILNLAVRGKLVPQDATDEPASELLKRIAAEKARLVRAGELKKAVIETTGRRDDDAPFDLPSSWIWTCLGNVAQYGSLAKVGSNKNIPDEMWVLDLEDIEKDTSRLIERVSSSARSFQSAKTAFERGDVLFGKLRPYLNKALVADQEGVCTTEIVPIRGYCGLVPEYVRLVLKSQLTMARVDQLMYGMKMPRLGTADAVALGFPLPPLAEQHRIVAKVDELMALCDRLEASLTATAATCSTRCSRRRWRL
jgi:type I restriction enzyme S subunit